MTSNPEPTFRPRMLTLPHNTAADNVKSRIMTDSLSKPKYRSAWHVVHTVLHEKDLPGRSRMRNTAAGLGNFYRVGPHVVPRQEYILSSDDSGYRTGGTPGIPNERSCFGRVGSCHERNGSKRGQCGWANPERLITSLRLTSFAVMGFDVWAVDGSTLVSEAVTRDRIEGSEGFDRVSAKAALQGFSWNYRVAILYHITVLTDNDITYMQRILVLHISSPCAIYF